MCTFNQCLFFKIYVFVILACREFKENPEKPVLLVHQEQLYVYCLLTIPFKPDFSYAATVLGVTIQVILTIATVL